MEAFVVIVFVLGYLGIAFEHKTKVDKLIPALLMMVVAWVGVSVGMDGFTTWFDSANGKLIDISGMLGEDRAKLLEESLLHHLGKTSEILIFLIGAMTIVEIVDHFNGFATIKGFIRTNSKKKLLWIIVLLAFFLSSIIDNLTATIVLITILRKILDNREDRMWYAGILIVAANAGGAWSPIGDVTTTMLWMADKVTAAKLMEYLFLPSVICAVIPAGIASFMKPFQGTFDLPEDEEVNPRSKTMLYLGLGMIVFVPIFKTIFDLPPYLGMMLALAVVSIFAEAISMRQFRMSFRGVEEEVDVEQIEEQDLEEAHNSPTFKALSNIEMPSILFFLGILLAVASMESLGLIFTFGNNVVDSMDINVFVVLIGVASSIIDNVPIVAAAIGMFNFETDHLVWHFIAFSAGTGGSMLIIGSAAGVVAMGMERISFVWYLKKIAWLAAVGFLAGSGWYLLERAILG